MIETARKPERLRVNEIFHSLQGEADAVGYPTVFVRLTGCPLRCQYCDTEYAFHAGDWLDLEAILETVLGYGTEHVCVTGGEPLAQPNCLRLLERLCDLGLKVSLETSGALDIAAVDKRVGGTSITNVTVFQWGDAENSIDYWADLADQRLVSFGVKQSSSVAAAH